MCDMDPCFALIALSFSALDVNPKYATSAKQTISIHDFGSWPSLYTLLPRLRDSDCCGPLGQAR